MTTAARRLVETLVLNGVDHVFCVPGESYLAVLDALHDVRDRVRVIACRHEAGAANMAEAYGKLTGQPGICMVTRGPGAAHASVGVHTAQQDSTPMILFVGQVAAVVLCHYPFRSWNRMHKGAVNLHGHSHGRMKPLPRQFDVGVDVRDYRPVRLAELLSTARAERTKRAP